MLSHETPQPPPGGTDPSREDREHEKLVQAFRYIESLFALDIEAGETSMFTSKEMPRYQPRSRFAKHQGLVGDAVAYIDGLIRTYQPNPQLVKKRMVAENEEIGLQSYSYVIPSGVQLIGRDQATKFNGVGGHEVSIDIMNGHTADRVCRGELNTSELDQFDAIVPETYRLALTTDDLFLSCKFASYRPYEDPAATSATQYLKIEQMLLTRYIQFLPEELKQHLPESLQTIADQPSVLLRPTS